MYSKVRKPLNVDVVYNKPVDHYLLVHKRATSFLASRNVCIVQCLFAYSVCNYITAGRDLINEFAPVMNYFIIVFRGRTGPSCTRFAIWRSVGGRLLIPGEKCELICWLLKAKSCSSWRPYKHMYVLVCSGLVFENDGSTTYGHRRIHHRALCAFFSTNHAGFAARNTAVVMISVRLEITRDAVGIFH